jgi:hypothetical protein
MLVMRVTWPVVSISPVNIYTTMYVAMIIRIRYVMVLARDRLECSKCFTHPVYQQSDDGHSVIVDFD